MKKTDLTDATILRQKAEKKISKRKSTSNFNLTESDCLKLNHELFVHQIELEIQNEELIQQKEKTEFIAEKYIELYNFAPLGYFTLTKTGEIIDLGVELNIIKKSGSWFSYGETKLGQGRESVKSVLHDNPELALELEGKILEFGATTTVVN